MNLPHNLQEAFDQIFDSNMNAFKERSSKFANQHQQNIHDYLQREGWVELEKFDNHFKCSSKIGIIVFCGDDVFIIEGVYGVPWARVNTIQQMEADLETLRSKSAQEVL